MALVTVFVSCALPWGPLWSCPPIVAAAVLIGSALGAAPGSLACRLARRRSPWVAPCIAAAGLVMAASTFVGWASWDAVERASSRTIMWSAPHHLGTLVGLPVLVAMQSAWFCVLYPRITTRRGRAALWCAVVMGAAALTLPATMAALAWWCLLG